MKFATQQLRCYVLPFWEFQSVESDKSFYECPVHFRGLIPAPQLNWINVLRNLPYSDLFMIYTFEPNVVYSFQIDQKILDINLR